MSIPVNCDSGVLAIVHNTHSGSSVSSPHYLSAPDVREHVLYISVYTPLGSFPFQSDHDIWMRRWETADPCMCVEEMTLMQLRHHMYTPSPTHSLVEV